MIKFVVLIVIFIVVVSSAVVGFSPPIYKYDDFDMCRARYNPATYCIAKVVTNVVDRNEVQKLNRIVTDFQPHLLTWAVCVQDCEQEWAALSSHDRQRMNGSHVDTKVQHMYPHRYFPDYYHHNDLHGKLIDNCINNRLQKQFNCTGYVEIEYCIASDKKLLKFTDWVSEVFLTVTVALLLLTLYGSSKDTFGRAANYTAEPIFAQAFSIRRTWKRFRQLPSGKVHQDFRYIEGVRVITCLAIVLLHTRYELFMLPTSSTEELQNSLNNIIAQLVSTLVPGIVQIFFTISGLLMAVNFLQEIRQKTDFEWKFLWNKIVNRLIRFLPVYVLWILFTSSWYGNISQGPMAYHTLKAHSQVCRYNWWMNLLFINNLPLVTNEVCMIHTWYLGADMQMFVLALGLLTVIWRFPKATFPSFVIATIAALMIPAFIAHQHALEPVLPIRLNDLLTNAMHLPWTRLMYMPGYANIGSFLAGIVSGYAYDSISNDAEDLRVSKIYKTVRALSTILLVGIPLVSVIWFYVEYQSPSIWIAIYVAIGRCYIPLFVSVRFVEAIERPAGSVRLLLSKPIFTFLGKLCYIVYIVHYSVIKIIYSRDDPNAAVDFERNMKIFVFATMVSFALAFVIYFCVEQPLGVYLKMKLIPTANRKKIAKKQK